VKVLLHQCCGPCSIYPAIRLREDGHELHGYFYNPNIHPYTEYKKRLETLQTYNTQHNIPYTIVDFYGLRPFIAMVEAMRQPASSIIANRCEGCYRMRLFKVAEFAKANGFDGFTTSLLYSRRQKHDLIRSIAAEAAQQQQIDFIYEDYRKGWQVGIDLSKQEAMYRQNYCGCIYSEEERWLKK
jgi:predicted adenine nucleotide alpha hydrolase (AANH) superfamily ATPase